MAQRALREHGSGCGRPPSPSPWPGPRSAPLPRACARPRVRSSPPGTSRQPPGRSRRGSPPWAPLRRRAAAPPAGWTRPIRVPCSARRGGRSRAGPVRSRGAGPRRRRRPRDREDSARSRPPRHRRAGGRRRGSRFPEPWSRPASPSPSARWTRPPPRRRPRPKAASEGGDWGPAKARRPRRRGLARRGESPRP